MRADRTKSAKSDSANASLSDAVFARPLAANLEAQHLLNRVTFGARPGDVERVRAMGAKAFLDEQLHPEHLDDSDLAARLKAVPTLSMSTSELIERYPQPKPAGAAAFAAGKPGPDSMKADADTMSAAMQSGSTPRQVLQELGREQLLRAVYSQRQLQEVMVQFWMNHFNVFAGKGPDKWMLTSFERDTIRPHALGRFEDLLVATAKSPAMLFYLDNWLSASPDANALLNRRAAFAGPIRPFGPFGRFGGENGFGNPALVKTQTMKRGLNENYGRELMELHTLGVDGGYTQQDVIEVARCLTGWTIRRPRFEAEFFFNPQLHDERAKTVLGHRIDKGGMDDGLEVLHILATHPSTARFISTKLCRRFVADDPPASVVDRASGEFMRSRGDMHAVLTTILTAPEFYSEGAYRAKVKSPFEMVASTLRALDADTDVSPALLGLLGRMGEPLFQYQSPAGFADRASTWISSSTLLARLNFATLVASNRIPGTRIDLGGASAEAGNQGGGPAGGEIAVERVNTPGNTAGMVDQLDARLMGGALTASSRSAILNSLEVGTQSAPGVGTAAVAAPGSHPEMTTVAALVIGSPEFQWR